jgi:hypothetical protein
MTPQTTTTPRTMTTAAPTMTMTPRMTTTAAPTMTLETVEDVPATYRAHPV